MERLGDEIRRERERVGPGGGGLEAVAAAWARSVGETVARNAWPARLTDGGVLHVATTSSTWAFELSRLAPTILEQLRPMLGNATPSGLTFAPGPVPGPPPQAPPHTRREPLQASPEQQAEAASLVAEIDDAELRELVARAAAASLAKAAAEPPDDRRF